MSPKAISLMIFKPTAISWVIILNPEGPRITPVKIKAVTCGTRKNRADFPAINANTSAIPKMGNAVVIFEYRITENPFP